LRTVPRSTRAVLAVLIRRTQHRGEARYLCLGDVVVEVAFATWLRWAGWADAYAKKRQVYGLHLVVLVWCRRDGHWRLPVACRLWGDPFSRHRYSPLVTKGALPFQWRSNVLATGLQLSCNATIRLTCTFVPQHCAVVARRRPWASGGNGVALAPDAAHLPTRLHWRYGSKAGILVARKSSERAVA